ncbi:zinc finger protein 426-like isoform X2 [Equus asinus]|uniref:zinc finger protein 426-like isoform X2 n=1 Tax=Equus asinus TaxID=9793 RepID=UPI0038F6D3D5
MKREGSVTFDEKWLWTLLDLAQKNLYREVMLETYKNLTTVGYQLFKPNLISWLEQEELRTVKKGILQEWKMQLKTKESTVPPQDILVEKTSNRIEMERSHNGWELCDCKECGKHVSEHSCFKTPRRTQNGKNTYVGSQYGKNFLTLHKKTSTGEKLSVFNQSGKTVSLTPNIVSWKTSMQGKGFECSDSQKAFVNQSSFQAQMRSHNREKLLSMEGM